MGTRKLCQAQKRPLLFYLQRPQELMNEEAVCPKAVCPNNIDPVLQYILRFESQSLSSLTIRPLAIAIPAFPSCLSFRELYQGRRTQEAKAIRIRSKLKMDRARQFTSSLLWRLCGLEAFMAFITRNRGTSISAERVLRPSVQSRASWDRLGHHP